MLSQPIGDERRVKQKIKSNLLLGNFYSVLAQFQIKRAHFFLVFPAYVLFCTKILALYLFRQYSAATFFRLLQKFGPHTHHHPDSRFTSHQQLIDLND